VISAENRAGDGAEHLEAETLSWNGGRFPTLCQDRVSDLQGDVSRNANMDPLLTLKTRKSVMLHGV
jgi:hypothetical protein